MEMEILTEGRKLVKTDVKEFEPGKITTVQEYDDGTIIEFHQVAEEVTVSCNKTLQLQADGKTLKIL